MSCSRTLSRISNGWRYRLASLVFVAFFVLGVGAEVRAAEPLSLRAPIAGRQLTFVGGWPMLSLGAWVTEKVAVGAHMQMLQGSSGTTVSSAGLSAGTRWILAGQEQGWSLPLHLSGGVLLPTLEPAFAISATLSMQALYRKNWVAFALGLVSPMAVKFTSGVEARLPILLEIWLLFRGGPLWFGVQANAGPLFVPTQSPTLHYQLSLALGFSFGA